MKRSIPEGIRVRRSILHPYYRVHPEGHGYETVIDGTGLNTALLADRFKGGDSVYDLMMDYDIQSRDRIETALRWEMMSRDVRHRLVLKAIQDGKV